MGKLKALPNLLTSLRPGLGSLPPVERTRDEDRILHAPWRKLYKTARWRALRMVILTRDMFTCQWPSCGLMTADTSQLVVDHKARGGFMRRSTRRLVLLRIRLLLP